MAGVLSVTSRLNKVRAMSPAEITHRLRYKALLVRERRQHASGGLTRDDRLERSLAAHLRAPDWRRRLLDSRLSGYQPFFGSVHDPDGMRRLFETTYVYERQAAVAHAARAREKRFEFFGRSFQFNTEIPWQVDPVSGAAWPPVYHADVPVHSGDVGFGDVKYVWELSRQQFVIDLAKSWFLTRERGDLLAIEQLVGSWIAGNPYATGVNWACALEPAFRVFSWLWGYYLTANALDEGFHVAWIEALHDHGRFIEQHLELYSSPYNHLVAEAAALYMLGLCFPEFVEAARWRKRGQAVLEDRLSEQFYADGGSVEQSTFYHHATVGFYLLAGLLGRAHGTDLSPEVWSAVERGIEFSMMLAQPDGRTPAIGGADDGKPIRMEHLPLWDFRPYHAIGAVLFNRGDFKYHAGRFHEDALWLLGPAASARFEAITPAPPRCTATSLPHSGYYVMRSDWSEGADYVCFDCGEQAVGIRKDSVPNSMHGHADCLSVIASLNGRPLLVDSGLFAYNCGGDWEAHFRETAAHNTARVDGKDQARHLNKMAWSHGYQAKVEGWNDGDERAWVIGSHDGYARGQTGVLHRRAVWLRPESYVLIFDEFVGTGEHDLTVNFQFAPGTLTVDDQNRAVFDDAVDVVWVATEPWTASRACGGPMPGDGWIAPSLGIRLPTPRLRLGCRTSRPRTSLLTVLAARRGARRLSVVERVGSPGRMAMICTPEYTDYISAAGISSTHPIETDAPLAVCRVRRDGSVETRRAGGTRFQVDSDSLHELCRFEPRELGVGR